MNSISMSSYSNFGAPLTVKIEARQQERAKQEVRRVAQRQEGGQHHEADQADDGVKRLHGAIIAPRGRQDATLW